MDEAVAILTALDQACVQLNECRERALVLADQTDSKLWRDAERLVREARLLALGARQQIQEASVE